MKNKFLVLLFFLSLFGVALNAQTAEEGGKKKNKVGFTYGLSATLNSNYIWRGEYDGGLNVQLDATVGYGGFFFNTWWNIGATNWTFAGGDGCGVNGFFPEVDLSIGFNRWGLKVWYIHLYFFDKNPNTDKLVGFFDYSLHGGRPRGEWRIKYRISDRVPLTFFWCTRTFGKDGYVKYTSVDANGDSHTSYRGVSYDRSEDGKRAYSSYFEIGYEFKLPNDFLLETQIGMTPYRSLYTDYQGKFAICNLNAMVSRTFDLGTKANMTAFAQVMMNPYNMGVRHDNPEAHAYPYAPKNGGRWFLWNVGCTVSLK